MVAGTPETDVNLKELLTGGEDNERMSQKRKQGKKHKGCCLKTKHFLSKLPGDFYKALKLLCNAGVPSMRNTRTIGEKKQDEKMAL